jgi:hypothetical protein
MNRMRCTIVRAGARNKRPGGILPSGLLRKRSGPAYSVVYLNSGIAFS